jgi:cytochrome P450
MTDTQLHYRRPPGPDQPVTLGLDAETLARLQSLQREYGDVVSLNQANGRLAYFVNDAVEVRKILTRRHARYEKGPGFERVKMLLGNGLIVSDGDVWRRSRTMIQPAFSRQNVHRLMAVMVECCDRRALRWADVAARGQTLNITEETCDFALELILISTFGDDYESRIVTQGENPFVFLSRDSTRDLSVVMKVRHLRELLDELMTLIVAGFETSANTLNWVWYLIAKHPGVEARLIDEAQRVVPNVSAVTAENLGVMEYTQQVLEEVLRLYPPVWLLTRRSLTDDDLKDFDVPAGTDIYLAPFVLHRTDNYWTEPDKFDPERFLPSDRPKKNRPFFPFSLGPRRCLGEFFSFLEMKVHLGLLLPLFRMSLVEGAEPELELAINLRVADDIHVRPEIR